MQVLRTWPLSQTAKTSPSHGEDMGSIPVGVTNLADLPALPKQVSFSQLVCGFADNILCAALTPLRVEEILQWFPKKETVKKRFLFLFSYCTIRIGNCQDDFKNEPNAFCVRLVLFIPQSDSIPLQGFGCSPRAGADMR